MSDLRVRVLQHVPFEGPALIGRRLCERGHTLETTALYRYELGESLPEPASFDWLILMGGPMSVNDVDSLPWLTPELELTARAIDEGKTVLGICLGAQLIAASRGARVYPNYYREIGWFPVTPRPARAEVPGEAAADPEELFGRFPAEIPALHWHGETFALPRGAHLLAASDACVNQAFSLGERVLGLQFHLEATPESTAELIEGAAADLRQDGPYVQTREEILTRESRFSESNRYMDAILAYLEAKATS
jgi:GMP synthase-like glutamine amidotransferase